jgi:hypothetical protein
LVGVVGSESSCSKRDLLVERNFSLIRPLPSTHQLTLFLLPKDVIVNNAGIGGTHQSPPSPPFIADRSGFRRIRRLHAPRKPGREHLAAPDSRLEEDVRY